ncbi:MAG: DNA polymerase IV [Firmicutes bacterium ADurb.Bin182]|nr:MAG: DNA polymerase IV [Firmicutes bacterium ADurb.Bin182]
MSILHVDLNSFFANCTIAASGGKYSFDTPLIITGEPDKRRGVVLAATYPVKKKGVSAGMPIIKALERCPEAILAKSEFRLYEKYSDKFINILSEYSPVVQRYGIDEAYLDYSGCEHLFGTPEQAANSIRERIKKELGLTVSVGVGNSMIMAKMGSDYKKPDAVTVLDDEKWMELIWPLPAGRLMYVDSSTKNRLSALGIVSIGDLAAADPEFLKTQFGVSGLNMWENAHGRDKTQISSEPSRAQGVNCSMTLPENITNTDDLDAVLLLLVEKAAYRMRCIGMRAGLVGVQLRFSDFSECSRQVSLSVNTDVTDELFEAARPLSRALMRGKPVRLVGVRLSKLQAAEQTSLFPDPGRERARKRDICMDELRKRFGNGIIKRASTLKPMLFDDE